MGKDFLLEEMTGREAKRYDYNVFGNYKVKHVHGSYSLKPVGRILIDL